jgi:hypothetical protein
MRFFPHKFFGRVGIVDAVAVGAFDALGAGYMASRTDRLLRA